MKRCSKCKLPKSLDEFFPRYDRPGKFQPQCKKCHGAQGVAYKRRNEAGRIKYLETTWRLNLFKKFNITVDDYQRMFVKQDGKCALCRQPETSPRDKKSAHRGPRRLAVDHDHTTGKVRGLLCSDCNRGIGLLKDDPILLRNAASYLELNIYVDKPVDEQILVRDE